MDENTKDVLQALLTVLAAIVGIFLGEWIRGRSGLTAERAPIYGNFFAKLLELESLLDQIGDTGPSAEVSSENMLEFVRLERTIASEAGRVQLIAHPSIGREAEIAAANARELLRIAQRRGDVPPLGWTTEWLASKNRLSLAKDVFKHRAREGRRFQRPGTIDRALDESGIGSRR